MFVCLLEVGSFIDRTMVGEGGWVSVGGVHMGVCVWVGVCGVHMGVCVCVC